MYSCAHNTHTPPLIIHSKNSVRLVLPNYIAVMWDKSLFHSASKSREIIINQNQLVTKEDTQLFANIWPYIENNIKNYNARTVDGIAR